MDGHLDTAVPSPRPGPHNSCCLSEVSMALALQSPTFLPTLLFSGFSSPGSCVSFTDSAGWTTVQVQCEFNRLHTGTPLVHALWCHWALAVRTAPSSSERGGAGVLRAARHAWLQHLFHPQGRSPWHRGGLLGFFRFSYKPLGRKSRRGRGEGRKKKKRREMGRRKKRRRSRGGGGQERGREKDP